MKLLQQTEAQHDAAGPRFLLSANCKAKPMPKATASVGVFGPRPLWFVRGKHMGRTQSLRIGPREEVEGSQGEVEPKKVSSPREVADR